MKFDDYATMRKTWFEWASTNQLDRVEILD